MRNRRSVTAAIAAFVAVVLLTSCAGLSAFGEQFNRAMQGVPATMTTYNEDGELIDEVKGSSFQVSRDVRFDTSNSDGTSKNDSSVLMISLGSNHISHVGSTLILAQDGITTVAGGNSTVEFTNSEPGVPWLNNLIEYNRNLWSGKGKTILVRSQNGSPIAVYAGDEVEILATDVPKSTWFRIDGMYLLVYRADYTVYDNELLP
jgi:hypothetical protein